VRVELPASFIRHETLHVVYGRLIDLGVFLRRNERRCSTRLHGELGDGVDQFLLAPDKLVGGLDNDPSKADILPGNIILFVRLQLPVIGFSPARTVPTAS
jgi:hypothetical protein